MPNILSPPEDRTIQEKTRDYENMLAFKPVILKFLNVAYDGIPYTLPWGCVPPDHVRPPVDRWPLRGIPSDSPAQVRRYHSLRTLCPLSKD